MEMKQILIPTDFSDNAQNAIKYAVSFFSDTPAIFFLMHVSLVEKFDQEECYYKFSDDSLQEKIVYDPIRMLESELSKLKKQSKNKQHGFYSIHENVQFIEAIRKQVETKGIDFIVMGTKGASKLKGDRVGTNTGNVITKVKCPVLVIPEKAKYKPLKNIVFPTDFNMFYKNRVLNTLSDILLIKQAKLSVVYISKKVQELTSLQEKNREFLQENLEDKPVSFYYITNENIESALDTFVKINHCELITMVAKNLNFFQRILFKPTVEKISYHTKVPFLVLHE